MHRQLRLGIAMLVGDGFWLAVRARTTGLCFQGGRTAQGNSLEVGNGWNTQHLPDTSRRWWNRISQGKIPSRLVSVWFPLPTLPLLAGCGHPVNPTGRKSLSRSLNDGHGSLRGKHAICRCVFLRVPELPPLPPCGCLRIRVWPGLTRRRINQFSALICRNFLKINRPICRARRCQRGEPTSSFAGNRQRFPSAAKIDHESPLVKENLLPSPGQFLIDGAPSSITA